MESSLGLGAALGAGAGFALTSFTFGGLMALADFTFLAATFAEAIFDLTDRAFLDERIFFREDFFGLRFRDEREFVLNIFLNDENIFFNKDIKIFRMNFNG